MTPDAPGKVTLEHLDSSSKTWPAMIFIPEVEVDHKG